ncbi:putative insect pheromone/odorant binding protein [Trypoxylus dichotomus]
MSIVISQVNSNDVEKIKEISKECIKTVGVDVALVRRIKDGDIADDPKVKEFISCVLKKLGMQGDDGSFNNDVIKSKMPKGLSETEKQDIMDNCLTLKGSSADDTAWKVYKCYREKSRLNFAGSL